MRNIYVRRPLAALLLLFTPLCAALAAQNLTWANIVSNATWNTIDPNWVGSLTYTNGDNVNFSSTADNRPNPRVIKIGLADGTPIDVAPASVAWLNSGTWVMSGGGITGGAALNIGWDANVIFSNNTADVLTFTGGTTVASGWLTFAPAAPGTYQFGRGAIIVSQRGMNFGMKFMPAVTGCILTNDFIVPAGGATWYGTCNGGRIVGNVQMDGSISLVPVGGTLSSNRLDARLALSGNRSLSIGLTYANSSYLYSTVDGNGSNTFGMEIGGNSDTWTDYCAYVADDPGQPPPAWNIGGFTKLEVGNVAFLSARNLGQAINLRTGCLILGGSGVITNWINDSATINLQGGKLLLRRDTAADQTENAGAANLQWGHNELRLTAAANKTYTLGFAEPLTRTNNATLLVAANDLGGSGGASGSGRVVLPATPPMIGGSGTAGAKNISIIPFLIGGLTTDNARLISGDAGSTFVTYDTITNSLRNLNTTSEFRTTIASAAIDENVRLTASETLTGDATVNALAIDGAGGPRSVDGAHTLTISSGALLFRGTAANTGTINTAAIDFAGREGVVSVVDTSPNGYGGAGLTINSVIRNGSLTKAGYGRLNLYGNNTFTGPFIVNSSQGGTFVYGAMATTNIQLYGGGTYLAASQRFPSDAVFNIDTRATLYLNGHTQSVINVRSGPSGGGTLNIGATGLLRLNPPRDIAEEEAFRGTITTGTVIKEGTNTTVLAGGFSPALLRLEEGAIWRKAGSGGHATKTVFAGGIYELAANHRDWAYNTAYVFETGGGWSSRGNAGKLITIYNGLTAQEWGVSAGFLPDGAPLMFNTVNSDGCVRYDSYISLGNTTGTPRMREIRVTDNPDSNDDYAYIMGTISGSAADKILWKTGDGLLLLGNANTFTGGTKISGGMLQAGADASFGAVPGVVATNVTLDGGGLRFSAAMTLSNRRIFLLNPGRHAVLDTASGVVNIQGTVTGGDAAAAVIKQGAGTLTLSGTNDLVAAIIVSNGTLTANNPFALGTTANPLAMAAPATMNMSGWNTLIAQFNGAAGAVIGNSAAGGATNTLTIAFDTVTATYDGQINNGTTRKTALTKQGSGIQVLNGDNGYTGPTTISGGALYLNGSNDTMLVSVAAGATLGGSGRIAGSVTVAAGGILAPGALNGTGALLIEGGLTLATNVHFTVNAAHHTMGNIVAGGTVTVPENATVTVNYLGGGWPTEVPLLTAAALDGATGYTLPGWSVSLPEGISGSVGVSGSSIVFRRRPGTVLTLR